MTKEVFSKNVAGWVPTANDYRLIFRFVDDMWIEVSGNVLAFAGMTLADYLAEMCITIDDDCTFCRIRRERLTFEYRDCSGYIRIDVRLIDSDK